MTSQSVFLAAALAVSMGLTGCEPPMTTTQDAVVAKVGGEVIGEYELGRAVARLGPMSEAESAQARGKVLDALVAQYLVSNAARNVKLDKVPEVALAMQQAQRQVLVEAYVERLFKDMPQPSDEEIRDYYNRHPELFAQRKVYRVRELELHLAPERVAEVGSKLRQSRNLSEFIDWLGAQGIAAKSGDAVKPAEQIPAAMLTQLVNMKTGEVTVVPLDENRISVLQLLGTQTQPISLELARDAISRLVLSAKRKTLLDAEIRKLRDSGKIEYASGFAPAQSGKP